MLSFKQTCNEHLLSAKYTRQYQHDTRNLSNTQRFSKYADDSCSIFIWLSFHWMASFLCHPVEFGLADGQAQCTWCCWILFIYFFLNIDALKKREREREAWFSIVCLTPPVIDKYLCVLPGCLTAHNVLLIPFLLCVSTSTGKMIPVVKRKWSSMPSLMNIFLTQFPISAKHDG